MYFDAGMHSSHVRQHFTAPNHIKRAQIRFRQVTKKNSQYDGFISTGQQYSVFIVSSELKKSHESAEDNILIGRISAYCRDTDAP